MQINLYNCARLKFPFLHLQQRLRCSKVCAHTRNEDMSGESPLNWPITPRRLISVQVRSGTQRLGANRWHRLCFSKSLCIFICQDHPLPFPNSLSQNMPVRSPSSPQKLPKAVFTCDSPGDDGHAADDEPETIATSMPQKQQQVSEALLLILLLRCSSPSVRTQLARRVALSNTALEFLRVFGILSSLITAAVVLSTSPWCGRSIRITTRGRMADRLHVSPFIPGWSNKRSRLHEESLCARLWDCTHRSCRCC